MIQKVAICLVAVLSVSFSSLKAQDGLLDANTQFILTDRTAGLFSEFASVIGALDYYDKGLLGGLIVNFAENGFYYSPQRGSNWWSYYFKPIKVAHKKRKLAVLPMTESHNSQFSLYAVSGLSPLRAHQIIRKYIRLQPYVKKKIQKIARKHLKHAFVIGVHFRGTDKVGGDHYHGNTKIYAEASPVAYQNIAEKINEIRKRSKKHLKIYVATDEAQFLEYMRKQFGASVVYQKCYRSSNGSPLHYNNDQDPYKIGLEAVVDCLLLAHSNVLIKTASNLSYCAMMFNPRMEVYHMSQNDWQKDGPVTKIR